MIRKYVSFSFDSCVFQCLKYFLSLRLVISIYWYLSSMSYTGIMELSEMNAFFNDSAVNNFVCDSFDFVRN